MEQRAVRMKQGEVDFFQLTLLGVAAVGGMMAGTCGALQPTPMRRRDDG